jgi:tyrosine-protein phosphatase SIW14
MRLLLLFATAALCVAADLPPVHVKNFAKVNDHIYRGAAPTEVGLQELGAMGVKEIIDLRTSGEGTSEEKKIAGKLNIKYINIPLNGFESPPNAKIQEILGLLQDNSETMFVHCRRGKDRTGTVVACYRIQHDGWDNQRALNEAKQHGMSSLEFGMHSYILHFTPVKTPLVPVDAVPGPITPR